MRLPARSIFVTLVSLSAISLFLGTVGVFAFPSVGQILSEVTGIKESTLKEIVDPVTKKIPLALLPVGSGSGLDADTLDGQHGSFYAFSSDLKALSTKLTSLEEEVDLLPADSSTGAVDLSLYLKKTEVAADSDKFGGNLPGYFLEAVNLTGTLSDARLSSSVALLNSTQTFTSLKSFSGGLSLVGGTLTLPSGAVSDSFLTSNVALLSSDQTFNGLKTFSSALIVPSSTDSINGLIINSGAIIGGNATLANLTSSSGSLTSTVADSASAVGIVLGTSTTYSTAGAKLLSLKNNTTEELFIDKDGNLTLNGNLVATGTIQGTQLISTVLTGTSPLIVSSTTQVANLNASFLEGNNSATLMSQPQPNLVLNSDFGRRNKWMTFMPEVFADTSGYEKTDAGAAPTVTSNILTQGAANNLLAWPKVNPGTGFWQDARASAQFKAVSTTGLYALYLRMGASDTDAIGVRNNGGTFDLFKRVGDVTTVITQVSAAMTLNNWYWLEIEAQGTTLVGKFYSSGASPVTKASATLSQTLTGTTSGTPAGGRAAIKSDQSNAQWGGLSTGDGGVYIEGWGPEGVESSFGGTKGGQAFGFDESTDAGPLGKQWALRAYIPAASRAIALEYLGGYIPIAPSVTYVPSIYLKTDSKGGSGDLINVAVAEYTSAKSFISGTAADRLSDAGETSWIRKTTTRTTDSTARYTRYSIGINYNLTTGAAKSATGTAFVMLPQYEQGNVATPWRNASADDAPIVWAVPVVPTNGGSSSISTTSTTYTEFRPAPYSNMSLNLFLPWDAGATTAWSLGAVDGDAAGRATYGTVYINDSAGSDLRRVAMTTHYAANKAVVHVGKTFTENLAAGKHHFKVMWRLDAAGTSIHYNAIAAAYMVITATRGK